MKTIFPIIIFMWLLIAIDTAAAFSQEVKPLQLQLPRDILSVKLTDEGSGFGLGKEIEIVFRKDGTAIFRGGKNSGFRKGAFRGAINSRQFKKLAKLIIANKFFMLRNRYEGNISDIGTKTIIVAYAGGEKTVINWGGSKLGAFAAISDAIREVEAKIMWEPRIEK